MSDSPSSFLCVCLSSVISPIDGKSMESITSVKIFHGSEFKANGKVIRWTEVREPTWIVLRLIFVLHPVVDGVHLCVCSPQVFFLQSEDQPNGLSDPADHSRLTENVARAFCVALCPHLKLLKEDGMAKLGLRVTLDSDQVLDHRGAAEGQEGAVVLEAVN